MKVVALVFCLIVLAVSDRKVSGVRTMENIPKGWAHKESANKDQPITFILALKQQNLDKLEELFWDVSNPDSPNYRNFMEIEEISTLVAPPLEQQRSVYKWLRKGGVTKIEPRGDSVYVKTTVAVAETLFQTKFAVFQHTETGRTITRQLGEFSIPARYSDVIEFVAGITEFPSPKFSLKKTPTSPEAIVSVAPPSIQALYKTPSTTVSGNSSAGVIEFEDQFFSPKDLSDFAKSFGVPIAALTSDHIVGTNDPNSPQIEATLDIQYILGVGLGATGWFWIEDYGVWLYGFANHIYSTKNVPLVNSISYGWNEEAQCQDGIGAQECQQLGVDSKGYVARVNVEFQKVGLRGVTLISASGDSGANGRTDPSCTETHLNPVFPGASPYLTSVGATQISASSGKANLPNPPPGCAGRSCASAGTEEAVSYSQSHFTSGGGFSDVAPVPAFQKNAVNAYLSSGVALPPASYFNAAGKGFPDVSALGSNILILSQGSIEGVGGTSASAPIFGGIIALLNDYVNIKTGKPLGFVSPLLYKMAVERPAAFNDVTVGDNICTEYGCASGCKGFKAAKGWDPVTGLGTPNYPEMLAYVKSKVVKEI